MDRRSLLAALLAAAAAGPALAQASRLRLPAPRLDGRLSLERLLSRRRSARDFDQSAMTLQDLSQILWAAQGVTGPGGLRTAPSAGAIHPLTVFIAVGRVQGLAPGGFRYDPSANELVRTTTRGQPAGLASAAGQAWLGRAQVVLAICADASHMRAKYGERAGRYIEIEVGHAAQNVLLQALALGLGSTDVGQFDAAKVRALLAIPPGQEPMLLMPVGRPKA